jgi:hypothetical protein
MIWLAVLAAMALLGATTASAQGLPAPLAARLAENPGAVIRQAEDIILGHGTAGAIDLDGIRQMIAIDRAAARARLLSQLLSADLDADGTVTAQEAQATAAARSADARGRLLALVAAADADGDTRLTLPELRAAAEAQALRAVSAAREARLIDLMAMDQNGDGALTLAEVRAAADAAQRAGTKGTSEQGA